MQADSLAEAILDVLLSDGKESLLPMSQGSWPNLTGLAIDLVDIDHTSGFTNPSLGVLPCLHTVCQNYCSFDAVVSGSLLDPWPALKTHHLDGNHYSSAAVVAICRRKWSVLKSLRVQTP